MTEPPTTPPQDSLSPAPDETTEPAKRRGYRTPLIIVAIVLLFLALVTAIVFLVIYLGDLKEAEARIDRQEQQIEEQKQLIEKKETFGAAMTGLVETTAKFNGVLMSDVIPFESYELLGARGWAHRWQGDKLDGDIADVGTAVTALEEQLAAASIQSSTNATGTTYEAITDQLGGGFVASIVDNTADTLCEGDVLACVFSDDPYTVHFDAGDASQPYMKDWQRTGVAYHEFAHVLQMTNPEPTDAALESFGGDGETMADCFALTYLPGWTLDHRVFINRYEYWDVSIGYGYTCNEAQRQVVRDWYSQLGFQSRPITQDR